MTLPPYEPLDLDRRQDYLDRLAQCPQQVSDYSFANVWGWAEEYGLEWSWGHNCVWLKQSHPVEAYWAPVGNWMAGDWAGCDYLVPGASFSRVPEVLALHWQSVLGERVRIEEARGHFDYVYSVPELVELKGNRFHKKKNLLSQFQRLYDHQYTPMTADCVEEVLQMQLEWCEWRECVESDPLVAENLAVHRVLQNWDRIPGLLGGTVRVQGGIVAYTVAEPLTEDTLVIHFEKGKPGYKGVYQAVNQMFLANHGHGFAHVNREQDLDDEGLRKAKLSYNPTHFMKKYSVTVVS
jgi:hypothetical protein